jgi:hypothetical protein
MVRGFGLGTLACVIALGSACGGGDGEAANGAGPTGSGGMSTQAGNGGAMGSGQGGASSSSTIGGGGASSGGASDGGASGAPIDDGSAGGVAADASSESMSRDAGSDVTRPPVCLGVNESCGDEGSTCCEAYVCRYGKCCTPTGIWSNCLTNSDCCSNSCVLRQCTCVPLGYSCTGPGQCCSGYACENGTCICPPDIRGCH